MNREVDRRRRRYRRALLVGSLAFALLAAKGDQASMSESLNERQTRVASMTPDEKEQLWRKFERFRALPPAEQARLRALNAQLERDAEGAVLRQVLESYQRWLEQLSSAERAELMNLEPEDRLKRIAQLRAEDARRLSQPDAQAFARWFEALLVRQHPELADRLAPQQHEADRRAQVRRIIELHHVRSGARRQLAPAGAGGLAKAPWSADDLVELREALSQKAQKLLDRAAGPAERRKLINGWLRQIYWRDAAAFSLQFSPRVSEERLRQFFSEELDASQRARLLSLPLDQMQRQLRRLYWQRHPPAWRQAPHSTRPTSSGGSQVQR